MESIQMITENEWEPWCLNWNEKSVQNLRIDWIRVEYENLFGCIYEKLEIGWNWRILMSYLGQH